MAKLIINETKNTPSVNFDDVTNILEIKGKSYPENTSAYYAPVFEWLDKYISELSNQKVVLNFDILYFNSSSSKVFMDLFDMFQEASVSGKNIEVNWIYDEENDMALEYGEEFKEDLQALPFNIVKRANT